MGPGSRELCVHGHELNFPMVSTVESEVNEQGHVQVFVGHKKWDVSKQSRERQGNQSGIIAIDT